MEIDRVEEIKQIIKREIKKQKIGRDNIDDGYLEGLAAGLFFNELLEKKEPGSGAGFKQDCEKIARQLGITLSDFVGVDGVIR